MSNKLFFVLIAAVLACTLFLQVEAADGVCYGNFNTTTATDTYCGSLLTTESCCDDSRIASIKADVEKVASYGESCSRLSKVVGCGACYVRNQQYMKGSGLATMCKSFCTELATACPLYAIFMKCDDMPTTNCYSASNINNVSKVAMALVGLILAFFAL